MINRIYILALLGLTTSLGLYNHGGLPGAPIASVAQAALPAAAVPLGEFRSEEGRFSISLPDGFGNPGENVSTLPTENGDVELKMYTATPTVSRNIAAMFAFANMEGKLEVAGKEAAMLKGARDNVLKSMKGKLTKEKSIEIDGHPGHQLVFSMRPAGAPKMYARLDMYVADPIMYQVMYISDRRADLESKPVVDYFKSFRLE